jgi:hypothetical protein
MELTEVLTVRVRFLAATRDEAGTTTHVAGEEICGELIRQNRDFLLVRTASGGCMYVDASRIDLYCVELDPADLIRPLTAPERGPTERPALRVA